jgi:hypothetical protein
VCGGLDPAGSKRQLYVGVIIHVMSGVLFYVRDLMLRW